MGQGVLNAVETAPAERAALLADAGLSERDGTLLLDEVALDDIIAAVGTPTYVYNARIIRERYRALDDALGDLPHAIAFAAKANSNLSVLRLLQECGAGADIVSGGELERALAAGFAPDRIVFSGVGKSDSELELAVTSGVGHIHLESAAELAALEKVAAAASRQCRVGIRVNPDVSADTHPFISTGHGGIKFGVPFDQVMPLAKAAAASSWLTLDTIAMHIGSQLLSTAPYVQGLEKLLRLIDELAGAGLPPITSVDIGGGLGIRYRHEVPLSPDALATAIRPLLEGRNLRLLLEPGRYLVGPAGLLLTQVLSRKHSGGRDLVIVDAGMNDLVRPSHYSAYHEILETRAAGRDATLVDVVGPVCETGDFLALDRRLPTLRRGEHLALLGAGAYGFVMSSNYNTRPRAAEVLVDGKSFRVVRPRETSEELMAGERSCLQSGNSHG